MHSDGVEAAVAVVVVDDSRGRWLHRKVGWFHSKKTVTLGKSK